MRVGKRARFVSVIASSVLLVGLLWNLGHADGKGIFAAKNCGSCHQIQGPATEKTFDDQLKKKGPELWYSGSKFNKEWLVAWLEKPATIRPLKYNSIKEKNTEKHVALSKQEAEEVGEYLMSLKAKEVPSGVIKGKKSPIGTNYFVKRYGCVGCHSIKSGAKHIGGVSGPDLSEAGKRLNGDWVYVYLKEPKVFKPVKMMPVFVGIINDNEMKTLAEFVAAQ